MSINDAIDSSSYIFFDFFDTIVHRSVDENAVIEKWASELSLFMDFIIEPSLLYNARKKAVKIVYKKGNTEEPNFDSIIKEMYSLLHSKLNELDYQTFLDISKTIELKIEKSVLSVDEECKKIIEYSLHSEKTIYVLSDFYFGKEYISELLSYVGLNPLIFTDIYVSSDLKKKKKTGNLYRKILEINGFNPKDCLMIGDNEYSDAKMAKAIGFAAYHRPFDKKNSIDIIKELQIIENKYSKYPFATYAFGFYRYIDLLYKEAIRNKYRKLVFLSREGFILKQLFDYYQQSKNKKINTEYLYVSRYSTFLPSLKSLEEETFEAVLGQYGDISLKSFLKNLHFTSEELCIVLKEFDDPDKIIKSFAHSKQFDKLRENRQFQTTYNTKVSVARGNFIKYLNGVVDSENNSIVLVDVGWKGTMQDNLYKIFYQEKSFIGLYFGIFNETGLECCHNLKKGLVFNKFPFKSNHYDIWEFETHLIEQLLVAPHGSTVDYIEKEGNVVPILDWTDEDKELYNIAGPIQEHIIKCFEEVCRLLEYCCVSENEMTIIFAKKQLKAELILSNEMIEFEKIALSEKTNNFGWFDQIPTSMSKKEKIRHLLKDIKNIMNDKESNSKLKYLHYFAVKMNARERYGWKKFVYRMFYAIENKKI